MGGPVRSTAAISAAVGAWLARQPAGPGAPMRFLYQDAPELKREFDALSPSEQDDVINAVDLLQQIGTPHFLKP